MALQRYREMRDFARTPEPRGAARAAARRGKATSLRYYVQRHHATRLHYDFRLEHGGVLWSWAVPKGPSLDPADKRLAVQTEDHPLEYGEFEGTIPEKQYGAGEVLLWDRGTWTPEDPDPEAAWRKGRLHFRLDGEKLHGSWVLARSGSGGTQWLLIKRRDEEAREGDITAERPESVKKAPRARRKAAGAELPRFVTPQLATLVSDPPGGKGANDWIYEVKHDGYRMLARCDGDDVRLFTRSGRDWSSKLPHLVEAIRKLHLKASWLDGEIVVQRDDGRADFQALQNAFDAGRDAGIAYFVFDAPFLDGRDLRGLSLSERKARLKKALGASRNSTSRIRYSDHLEGEAAEILEKACAMGLEGLIGKRTDATYAAGRSRSWIKLKCRPRQDFVIVGYTAPGGSRTGFGALLVAVYDAKGKLAYAGKVGTGFDEENLVSLNRKLSALRRKDSPLANPPREKGVTWVDPKLVCEVAYAERTSEGLLRQASFLALRADIPPKSVGDEKPQPVQGQPPAKIKLTHPQRLVWPTLKITKRELFDYYVAVSGWMLPHLANRPLTLVRCPDGAEAKCFYQRHLGMGASPGELKQFRRERSSKGHYLYLDSAAGLLSAVQNGAVEFHTWGATVPDATHPDRITMDLDPGPGVSWARLLDATRLTRTILETLGLKCFLKTTGGKGLHVVAPVEPRLEWGEVKDFTRLIAEFLVRAEPKLFVSKISKDVREGKVFVDYLRNSETASAVAAFSARARKEAGVSTPLEWDELGKKDLRDAFTVKTVPERLRELTIDPWAEYAALRQPITGKMLEALRAK